MRAFVSLTKFIIEKYLKLEIGEDFAWMNVAPVAFL